jgi:hypothetical protein
MPEIPCIRIDFSDMNNGQAGKGIWMLGTKMINLPTGWHILSPRWDNRIGKTGNAKG